MVSCVLQMWRLAFWPNCYFLVSSDQRNVWESLDGFWQTPSGLSCAFYWRVASVWTLYHKGLHRGTLELSQWPSGFLVTSLTTALLPRLLSLAGWPALGRVLVPCFFHLRMMEATVFLGTLNSELFFWYPSPDLCRDIILSWSAMDSSFDLMAWFYLWHALSTVGPYIERCVPFQIMSNQLNLPQVDSNQVVETSQGWSMETGCTWAQFWVSKQRVWMLT